MRACSVPQRPSPASARLARHGAAASSCPPDLDAGFVRQREVARHCLSRRAALSTVPSRPRGCVCGPGRRVRRGPGHGRPRDHLVPTSTLRRPAEQVVERAGALRTAGVSARRDSRSSSSPGRRRPRTSASSASSVHGPRSLSSCSSADGPPPRPNSWDGCAQPGEPRFWAGSSSVRIRPPIPFAKHDSAGAESCALILALALAEPEAPRWRGRNCLVGMGVPETLCQVHNTTRAFDFAGYRRRCGFLSARLLGARRGLRATPRRERAVSLTVTPLPATLRATRPASRGERRRSGSMAPLAARATGLDGTVRRAPDRSPGRPSDVASVLRGFRSAFPIRRWCVDATAATTFLDRGGNTSAFNCRPGRGTSPVEHAYGRAIDLNPSRTPTLADGTTPTREPLVSSSLAGATGMAV